MRIVKGLKNYFSDKRNRIVHATVGISAMIGMLFNVIALSFICGSHRVQCT